MTMLEKVAEAIRNTGGDELSQARAAIEAIRMPDTRMSDAGGAKLDEAIERDWNTYIDPLITTISATTQIDVYQAMIDVILEQ